jgi:hypothetical protein
LFYEKAFFIASPQPSPKERELNEVMITLLIKKSSPLERI